MNIALVKAGGIGTRMGATVPKQFVEVNGKPVVVYTLEVFERHPEIDAIIVVCVAGWHDALRSYVDRYGLTKIVSIVGGGNTSLRSIREGVRDASGRFSPDDFILIHDANRPLVSREIISDVIAKANEHGSAVAAIPCTDEAMEAHFSLDRADVLLDHKRVFRIQTPDAYRLGDMATFIESVPEKEFDEYGATNALMLAHGRPVYFARGSEVNIRLTTWDDITMMRSLLDLQVSDNERG